MLPVAAAMLTPVPLMLVRTGDAVAVAIQSVTLCVVAGFLVAGVRRRDAIWRSRLLLLLAVGAGLGAGTLRLGRGLATGNFGGLFWAADAIALLWAPLVVASLAMIAPGSQRRGFRIRSVADGMIAATSLWYLILGLGLAGALADAHATPVQRALVLAAPIGDVFVVATALAVYARCSTEARRVVGWGVAGFSAIALSDLIFAIPLHDRVLPPSSGAGLLNEVGLLFLVASSASAVGRWPDGAGRARPRFSITGALPYTPLLGCIVITSRMVLSGSDMPKAQLLPALCVALALVLRQFVGTRDRERLVEQLQERELTLEAELRRDALTGLGNRTHLTERLTEALGDPACWPVAVVLLDLNDFKIINDNHGHHTGDAILVEVAHRLVGCVRPGDSVSRLGGDEFAVVATGVHDDGASLSGRLVDALEQPVVVDNRWFSVRASIGVVNEREGAEPTTVLAHADVAMYQAKERKDRTSTVEILSSEGRHNARRRLRLQEDIAAPDLTQFRVVYQPVVGLATGDLRGVEALLRWDHPDLGPVPPDVFIPLAELSGSIIVLGEYVLRTALADLASLQALGPQRRLAVGVNVSPRQLTDPGLLERTLSCLSEHGLANDQLNLEITEHAFETDLDLVAETLHGFAGAGVSVAVDDFGTGYSSLRYLQLLPVDIMKIDKSFVMEMAYEEKARRLISSIIAMASVLDLQLVAEGIETTEQLLLLQELGCELGQGYLFSRPATRAEIEALIRADRPFAVGKLIPATRRPVEASSH